MSYAGRIVKERIVWVWALAVVVGSTVAACGDPNAPRTPSLRFAYTGDRSGVFQASGSAEAAYCSGALILHAEREHDSGNRITFSLRLAFITEPGTYSLPTQMHPHVDFCHPDWFIFYDGDTPTLYGLLEGTVTVTQLSDTRVRGTFSGEYVGEEGSIAVSRGAFDLAIE